MSRGDALASTGESDIVLGERNKAVERLGSLGDPGVQEGSLGEVR